MDFASHDHSSWKLLSVGTPKQASNDGNPTCRAARTRLKDTLDDEMMLAGLEALVAEELGEHLKLNSNRLRTFKDARPEIVTYVEAKFGLWIRDSKPNNTLTRGQSDPMDVDAVNSLSSGNGKKLSGKGKRSKSWSKSEGKRKVKECKEKSKGRGKISKTGSSGLENPKSETSSETKEYAQTHPTDNLYADNFWCE